MTEYKRCLINIVKAILHRIFENHMYYVLRVNVMLNFICICRTARNAKQANVKRWLLVGCIEDLRRFSGISAISRLGTSEIQVTRLDMIGYLLLSKSRYG